MVFSEWPQALRTSRLSQGLHEAPMTTDAPAVFRARPTVRVADQAYPLVSELLTAMEIVEQEGGLSSLELRLSNVASDDSGGADLAFADGQILRLGAPIAIYAGDELAPREIFRGTVSGLEGHFSTEGPPELVVLAEDAFQRARMARRTRLREDLTLADLVAELAGQLGLRPQITGLTENIGVQMQLNESDLAFARRLLARYDADLQIVGEELHASPRADVRRGVMDLALYGELLQARVLADLSQQVTEVTVAGWDAASGRRASAASQGGDAGPGSGRRGAELLRDALGERAHHIAHMGLADDQEAQALADAAFAQRARRLVVVEGCAQGNPALRVGAHLGLQGLGPFDNTYYVVRARHCFDMSRGYRTHFEAECAFWREAP
jgi:phage protein D